LAITVFKQDKVKILLLIMSAYVWVNQKW